MRIDLSAKEVCIEKGERFVWYGNPQLCHDIYTRSGRTKAIHPLNVISSVLIALSKSKLWVRTGYINHMGRDYPVFEVMP